MEAPCKGGFFTALRFAPAFYIVADTCEDRRMRIRWISPRYASEGMEPLLRARFLRQGFFLAAFLVACLLFPPVWDACAGPSVAMPAEAAARQQHIFARQKKDAERQQISTRDGRRRANRPSGQNARGRRGASQNGSVHADAWAFGRGTHASQNRGSRGMSADELQRRAVPTHGAHAHHGKAQDAPLDAAAVKERAARGGMGLSWKDEGDAWRSDPDSKIRPDEGRMLENRHRIGAYAEVEDHDVRFKAGPEIIIKDEKSASSHAINKDQPNSALGLGMQLEFGF